MNETVIGLLAISMLLMFFFFCITMMSFNDLKRDYERLEKSNQKIQDKLHQIDRDIYKIDYRK